MIFDTVLKDVVIILITFISIILLYFKWSYQHWQRKGVPFLEPSLPFGNMENPFKRKYSVGLLMQKYYEEFKAKRCKYGGLYSFSQPTFITVNPEYVKNIMQKDFQYFVDRGVYFNEKVDPVSAHLFNVGGQKWRKLRTKLTPTFTSGKMKMMLDTVVQCGHQLLEAVKGFEETKEPIDIKDTAARFTSDVIGSVAFGLDCNSFKDRDAEFLKRGKDIFASQSIFKAVLTIFAQAKPEIANVLGVTILPPSSTSFFIKTTQDTLRHRKEKNVTRNDMLQILINLREEEKRSLAEDVLTTEQIAAQALVFFAAGFETSSTTMAFCLYELAQNQDIQARVRTEINTVLSEFDENITYESLGKMVYLGQVIDETLRKYPPLPVVTRRCVADYVIPGTEAKIDKGTLVFIPIFALHRDPEYFPNPEMFDPERFSDENKSNIRPFTYIPFGEGPRICIGLRFGIMQAKVGLALLLKNYKFSLNEKTPVPLKMNPYNRIVLESVEDVLLNVVKL